MRFFLSIFTTLVMASAALGSGSGITYHGRLLKPNGEPVTASNVLFRIQIRTEENTNCLMYQEVHARDLSQSSGMFSITLNRNVSVANTEPFTLDQIFRNLGTLTFPAGKCSGSNSLILNPTTPRQIAVAFNDGTFPIGTWEPLPTQTINFVPMALEATTLTGHKPENFFRVVDGTNPPDVLPPWTSDDYDTLTQLVGSATLSGGTLTGISGTASGFTGSLSGDVTGGQATTRVEGLQGRPLSSAMPASGQVLMWNSTTSEWEPATPPSGGGGGGSVAWNDVTGKPGSFPAGGTAGGDLTGNYPNPTIANNAVTNAKIVDGAVGPSKLAGGTADGQILRYDGADWQIAKLSYMDLVNNGSGGGSPWPATSCAAGEVIVWDSVADGFRCQAFSITEADPTVEAFAKNAPSADFSVAGNTLSLVTVPLSKGGTGATTREAALNNLLPLQGSQSGKILQTDGTSASWVDPSALPALTAYVEKSGDTMTGALNLPVNGLAVGTNQLVVSGGNVGIGTASPNSPLVVQADGNDYARIRVRNVDPDGGSGYYFGGDSSADYGAFITLNNSANATNGGLKALSIVNPYGDITFGAAPAAGYAERMRISSNGNVGVGTSSPGSKLEVNGEGLATGISIRSAGSVPVYLDFGNTDREATIGFVGAANEWAAGSVAGDLVLRTEDSANKIMLGSYSGGPALNILGTGNVGIGTASPAAPLELVSANASGASFKIRNTQMSGNTAIDLYDSADNQVGYFGYGNASSSWTPGTETVYVGALNKKLSLVTGTTSALTVATDGNIGIGTLTPGVKLDVAGTVRASEYCLGGDCITAWPSGGSGGGGGVAWNDVTGKPSSMPPNGSATGDLSGSYPNPTVAQIQGRAISSTAPASGEVLKWNGSAWAPAADTGGGVTSVGLAMPSIFSVTNSPVTSTGTLTASLASQPQSMVFAAPLSGPGAPAFRFLQISDLKSAVSGNFLTGSGCGASQALVYVSASDTISCQTISPGANSVGSSQIADGSIARADLASSLTDGLWEAAGGNVSRLSGNVGIGTNSPAHGKLHIEGGDLYLNQNADSDGGFITEAGLNGIGLVGNGARLANPDLYVADGGSVGIGTTSPSALLDIAGPARMGLNSAPDALNDTLTVGARPKNDNYASIRLAPQNSTSRGWKIDVLDNGTTLNKMFFHDVAGGAIRMTLNSDGNVGIGTASPTARLSLYDTNDNPTDLKISTPGTQASQLTSVALGTKGPNFDSNGKGWSLSARGDAYTVANERNDFGAHYWNGSTWTNRFAIDSLTGNVGIGTDVPTSRLHVKDSADVEIMIDAGATSRKAQLAMMRGSNWNTHGSYVGPTSANTFDFFTHENIPIRIASNGASRIYVDTAGNVGIGNTAPGEKLVLGAHALVFHDGGNKVIGFNTDYTGSGWTRQGAGNYHGLIGFNPSLGIMSLGVSGSAVEAFSVPVLNMTSAGFVGIGTAAPQVPLHVATTQNYNVSNYGYLNAGGASTFSGTQNTTVSVLASGRVVAQEFNATSDVRAKENIRDIASEEAVNFVMKSRPVHYRWKEGEQNENFGFLAQDLLRLGLNDVISAAPDKSMKQTRDPDGLESPEGFKLNVNYNQLVALLTKAMQVFGADLEELRSENRTLKQELEKEREENKSIKAWICAKDPEAPFCRER